MAGTPEPGPRVLVVDDHPMVREGLRSMLGGTASRWEEAASGEEALRKLGPLDPELVLLDIQLPDLDGLTLLRRIKALSPRSSVLVITMHDEPGYVRDAMRAGAAGYVLKGVTRRELMAAVRATLEGEAVVAPGLLQQALGEVTADAGGGRRGPDTLTPAEREILRLVSQGLTNKEISRRLGWSVGTVKKYVQRILEKLQVSDRTQAAVEAVRRGLVESPPAAP